MLVGHKALKDLLGLKATQGRKDLKVPKEIQGHKASRAPRAILVRKGHKGHKAIQECKVRKATQARRVPWDQPMLRRGHRDLLE
jgi:hypothetical protein